MTEEMQSLGVVARLFPLIVSGEKTSTIRWREQRIVPGQMKFICDEGAGKSVIVNVTRCLEMPLSNVASFVGRSDEWPDEIILNGMREHYPDIELSSIVQVVEYELPSSA